MIDQTQDKQLAKRQASPLAQLKAYAQLEEVKGRFAEMLGQHEAQAYINSVLIAVANSEALQECTPKSIMSSAIRAAALRLSVDPIMRQAYLVPFRSTATLIVDYRGLVQLMERTGLYDVVNVFEVFEGETVKTDRLSGRVSLSGEPTIDEKTGARTVKGWCAYFKTRNGTEKFLYMTNEECDAHGEKYSKAYNNSKSGWQTDRQSMRRKTVLRLLAQRWGQFSPSDAAAIRDDVIENGVPGLPDDTGIVVVEEPRHTIDENMAALGFDAPAKPAPTETPQPDQSADILTRNEILLMGLVDCGAAPDLIEAGIMVGLLKLDPDDDMNKSLRMGKRYRELVDISSTPEQAAKIVLAETKKQ